MLCCLNDALALSLVPSNFDKSSWRGLGFGGFSYFVKSHFLEESTAA